MADASKKTYYANTEIRHNRVTYRDGDAIDLTEEQAAQLKGIFPPAIRDTKTGINQAIDPDSAGAGGGNKAGVVQLAPDFPARKELMAAGFDTTDKVKNASDQELLEVDNVGEVTLSKIRAALATSQD